MNIYKVIRIIDYLTNIIQSMMDRGDLGNRTPVTRIKCIPF